MVSRDTTKDSSPLFLCDTVRKKRMGDWESFIFPFDKKLDRIIELLEKQSKG